MNTVNVHEVAALVTLPVDVAEDAIGIAAQALDHRRAMRERRGKSGQMPRCSACCRFKANEYATCKACGFTPGQGYAA